MVDLNKIRFSNTFEGIRCAGISILVTTENKTAHSWAVFIHREDVGKILGLYRYDENKYRWDRMLDSFNQVIQSYSIQDPGFTVNNTTSAKRGPGSRYELQIPEYIRKEVIYKMANNLDNDIAKQYVDDVVNKVIPFFERNASPEEIADVAIIRDLNKVEQHLQYEYPTLFTISSARKDVLDLLSNKVTYLCNFLSRVNKQLNHIQFTSRNIKDYAKYQLDDYLYRVYGMNLHYFCAMSISPNQPIEISNDMIDDMIYRNDFLYNLACTFLNNCLVNLDQQRLAYINTSDMCGHTGFITLKDAWYNKHNNEYPNSYRIDLAGNIHHIHTIKSTTKSINISEQDLLINYMNQLNHKYLYEHINCHDGLPNYDQIMDLLGAEKDKSGIYIIPNLSTADFQLVVDLSNSNVVFGQSPVEFVSNVYPTPKCILDQIDDSNKPEFNNDIKITDFAK